MGKTKSGAAEGKTANLCDSRWIYWVHAITTGTSALLFLLCYRPPGHKHLAKSMGNKMDIVKHIDYVGFALYGGGLTSLLLGLSE